MEIDFSSIIASQLELPYKKKTPLFKSKSFAATTDSKPFMQMAAFPISLEIEKYVNPFSPSNPNGSYLNAYRFRDLVNHPSKPAKFYTPDNNSIERVYNNMLGGADIPEGFKFVSLAFSDARDVFKNARLSKMDGIPDADWRLADALPNNWATKIQDKNALPQIVIDMNDLSNSFNNKFSIIDGNKTVDLKIFNSETKELNVQQLGSDTFFEKIKFKYIWVNINREWLNTELFVMNNWYITGLPIGYYSNGKTEGNKGVLPLIPTSLLIGTDIEIIGSVGKQDAAVVQNALDNNHEVSIDVFPINNIDSNNKLMTYKDVFVMGYICELIPISPKMQT